MKLLLIHLIPLFVVCQVYGDIEPNESILSNDFQDWLDRNSYQTDRFASGKGYSYGGRSFRSQLVHKTPIIFIHGNSDQAVGNTEFQSGWTSSINYFLSKGYRPCELYAITWGPADISLFFQQYHSLPYLFRIRRFIQAVKEYTNQSKIHIIAHSMGVTLARKAIKGGIGYDPLHDGYYNLGSPLSFIETFIGIAGANQGIMSCVESDPMSPMCDDTNGFYPGYLLSGSGPFGMSTFLTELNSNPAKEAQYIFSIWSKVDSVIGAGSLVYNGKVTSRCPGQNGERVYTTFPYGHHGVKDLTGDVQYNIITNHQV